MRGYYNGKWPFKDGRRVQGLEIRMGGCEDNVICQIRFPFPITPGFSTSFRSQFLGGISEAMRHSFEIFYFFLFFLGRRVVGRRGGPASPKDISLSPPANEPLVNYLVFSCSSSFITWDRRKLQSEHGEWAAKGSRWEWAKRLLRKIKIYVFPPLGLGLGLGLGTGTGATLGIRGEEGPEEMKINSFILSMMQYDPILILVCMYVLGVFDAFLLPHDSIQSFLFPVDSAEQDDRV